MMNRRKVVGIHVGLVLCVILQACGASDLHKLNTTLDQAAATMNGAAKTNHSFYESGVYGPVGSEDAIKVRQKVATVIHEANERLIIAINLAKTLKPETFESGKLAILSALSESVAGLHVGNPKIDLVLQSIATVINQAVIIVSTFKASDLPRVLHALQNLKMEVIQV